MKSPKYAKVKALIQQDYIKDFKQIATEVGKMAFAADIGMHFETLMVRVYDPGKFTVEQLANMSDLLEIDHKFLLEMADRLRKKKGKK